MKCIDIISARMIQNPRIAMHIFVLRINFAFLVCKLNIFNNAEPRKDSNLLY